MESARAHGGTQPFPGIGAVATSAARCPRTSHPHSLYAAGESPSADFCSFRHTAFPTAGILAAVSGQRIAQDIFSSRDTHSPDAAICEKPIRQRLERLTVTSSP